MKIAFLLFSKTQLIDLAGPAQVFYEASQLGGRAYELLFCSISSKLKTEQNLFFHKLHYIENLELQPSDLIVIPGIDFKSFEAGFNDEEIENVKDWVWSQFEKGVRLATICSGSLILAKMGLLNGVKCTTHWKCMEYLKAHYPKAKVMEDRLYCFDRRRYTSAGMTAGIDMSLALVEKWDSALVAAKVAQEMVINVRRPETKEQRNTYLDFQNHFNPDVYKAQEILANRLDAQFTVEDLAKVLNKSSRHLTRLFKKHTGQTIQAFRDNLRIEHGEKLLLHSERSIKEIAIACGFETSRQFIRLWNAKKGCPPGQYRKLCLQKKANEA